MIAGSVDTRAPTLVLGLGNLLLGDDGLGLRLLEELRRTYGETEAIDFVDGGTQGLALLGYLANRPRVVILDAVSLGAPPGTVHVLGEREIEQLHRRRGATIHEGNGLEVLALARLLRQAPGRVAIVGVEPASIRTGLGLSEPAESGILQAVAAARRILTELAA